MISILIIVIIILVVSFVMAFIVSSNKDFTKSGKLTDDPSILFDDEVKNSNQIINKKISEEIEIVEDKEKNEEEYFDDELI